MIRIMCAEHASFSDKRLLSNLLLFAGMVLGVLSGWLDIPFVSQCAIGTSDLFLRLLKLVSLPIIFLAVTSTITGMKDLNEMRTMGRRVFIYTFGTTLMAATIALVLYITIDPAHSVLIEDKATSSLQLPNSEKSYLTFLFNIIPSNIVGVFVEGNVMGIVCVAILLSIAILFLPTQQKSFLNQMFAGLFAAMVKLTTFIIALMPIAIWSFMTLLVKDLSKNYAEMSRLVFYLICIIGANLLQGFVILPLLLKIKKIAPLTLFKGMIQPLTVAFFSKSSNATLPIALRAAEKNLGISNKVCTFSLPMCTVLNMNGCAAFILITTLFVSSVNGVSFGTFDYIGWIFLATFAAIGNAGVPMGCFFLTSAFLIGMDIPLYMMGLILPFYTLIDMVETTLNVWSDISITAIVDKDLSKQPSLTSV